MQRERVRQLQAQSNVCTLGVRQCRRPNRIHLAWTKLIVPESTLKDFFFWTGILARAAVLMAKDRPGLFFFGSLFFLAVLGLAASLAV